MISGILKKSESFSIILSLGHRIYVMYAEIQYNVCMAYIFYIEIGIVHFLFLHACIRVINEEPSGNAKDIVYSVIWEE